MLRQALSPNVLLIEMIEKYTSRNLFTHHWNRTMSKIKCGSCLAVHDYTKQMFRQEESKTYKEFLIGKIHLQKGIQKSIVSKCLTYFSGIRLQLLKYNTISLINNMLDFNILVYC